MAKHYITSSDIKVTPHIWQSHASRYASRSDRAQSERAINIVETALPILKKELDLPRDIKIRIASVKGNYLGWYIEREHLAVLDYKTTGRNVLEILAHELVHAEQYHQGRLAQRWRKGKYVTFWKGDAVRESYRNRPHEQEAFKRQVELADLVVQQLGTDFMVLKVQL
jgi:hypothetical protein